MKILVTGVNGQLGHDVVAELSAREISCKGVDISDFDLTNEAAVSEYIREYAPDAVVHCAAFTAVDKAEEAKELAFAVNVTGTENVARACKEISAKMVYISTDYVFPGEGETPYEVSDKQGPKGYYGYTKLMGEEKVKEYLTDYFIVRTAWVFGVNGNNFVKTMLRFGNEKPSLTVVCDQFGSPTYCPDLAFLLCDMVVTDRFGTYHATNEGFISWAEFATEIMQQAGLATKIIPVSSEEYASKAVRPKNSRLSKSSLDAAGFTRLPPWQDALARYMNELQ